MKLDEAIEVQTISLDHPYITTNPELRKAMKLLIEAGKREIRNRKDPDYVLVGPLPGETEE